MKMNRALMIFAVAALLFAVFARPGFAQSSPRLVAVLDLANNAGLTEDEAYFLTNKVRSVAAQTLPPAQFLVMTRESMDALLPPDTDLKKCAESKCELEMGRKLGAEYIVTGEVLRFGGDLRVQIGAHHVPSGAFLDYRDTPAAPLKDQEANVVAAAREVMGLILQHAKARAAAGGRAFEEGKIGQQPWDAGGVETTVVRFESDPPGAFVTADGTPLCQATPCAKELTRGAAPIVSMQLERYQTRQEAIAVKKGLTVSWKLLPNFGMLSVTSKPSGLAVKVNGKDVGKTPLTDLELDPGPYEVLVSDPRYNDEGEKFNLATGQEKTVSVTASPREGALKVSAHDQNDNALEGDVYVDGARVGTAPGTFKTAIGRHKVEVRTPQGNWKATAEAKYRQVTPVTAVIKVAAKSAAAAPVAAVAAPVVASDTVAAPPAAPSASSVAVSPPPPINQMTKTGQDERTSGIVIFSAFSAAGVGTLVACGAQPGGSGHWVIQARNNLLFLSASTFLVACGVGIPLWVVGQNNVEKARKMLGGTSWLKEYRATLLVGADPGTGRKNLAFGMDW